jgi:hypothetical protein
LQNLDYLPKSGTLSFPSGVRERTISVPILDDSLDEYDEQFYVGISNAVGGVILDPSGRGTIIQDNDPAPQMSINDARKVEGNEGTTLFEFSVSLSGPSGKRLSATYSTYDGTAIGESGDFYHHSDILEFAPGELSKTIGVHVVGEILVESDETFDVALFENDGYTLADGRATGTIVNDDTPASLPVMRITDASLAEGDRSTRAMTFTVYLSSAISQEIRVIIQLVQER